jgi:hypothetical protein
MPGSAREAAERRRTTPCCGAIAVPPPLGTATHGQCQGRCGDKAPGPANPAGHSGAEHNRSRDVARLRPARESLFPQPPCIAVGYAVLSGSRGEVAFGGPDEQHIHAPEPRVEKEEKKNARLSARRSRGNHSNYSAFGCAAAFVEHSAAVSREAVSGSASRRNWLIYRSWYSPSLARSS